MHITGVPLRSTPVCDLVVGLKNMKKTILSLLTLASITISSGCRSSTVPDAVSSTLETFHLKIHRIPTARYEQSLELHVRKNIGEPEAIALQISQAEASRIAKALASSGYFADSIKPSGRWPDPEEQPCYRIAVQTKDYVSYLYIGYSASTLAQLQSLSGVLGNNVNVRKALDTLCRGLNEELKRENPNK